MLSASPVHALLREYAVWLDFDLGFQGFEAEVAGLPGDYASPQGRLFLATLSGEPLGLSGLSLAALSPCVCGSILPWWSARVQKVWNARCHPSP